MKHVGPAGIGKRRAARLLQWLLRIAGAVCVLAVVPLLMPRSWMAETHAFIGLGPFPEQPIAEYLARSTSGLSGLYGGLLLILASDVYRYADLITYQALAVMFLSLCGLVLGYAAGLPLVWVAGDAACCWGYCLPTLWLQRQMISNGASSS